MNITTNDSELLQPFHFMLSSCFNYINMGLKCVPGNAECAQEKKKKMLRSAAK